MKIRNQTANRPGFTFVELIIVIAIIAILAALTTGVAMRFYGIQQQRNSEVTVIKVYERLKDQWDTVIRQAKEEPLPPTSYAMSWNNPTYNPANPPGPTNVPGIFQIAGGDMRIARVIWIKARLRQEFPMNYSEIIFTSPALYAFYAKSGLVPTTWTPPLPGGALPALQVYVDALANGPVANGFIPGNAPTQAENSACLLMSLTLVNRGGAKFSADDLNAQAVADTDNDGLKEIVDGWRTPVMYFRWPFGNSEMASLNSAAAGSRNANGNFADPQDPEGVLVTPYPYSPYPTTVPTAWWNSSGRSSFEWLLHSISAPNPPVPPLFTPNPPFAVEYYMIPVIASAGPNKSFGLVPAIDTNGMKAAYPVPPLWPNPMVSDGSGDDNDNIYSYRLRLGAPGN